MNFPKNSQDNLAYRARLLSRANQDPVFQNAVWNVCKDSPLFWVNVFVWTYDPRGDRYAALGYETSHMPFITWEFQDEYILEVVKAVEGSYDLLTEKSRDMGASWLMMAVFTWFWLFKGVGNDFLIGSRKQEYVDQKGNMSTLFQKMRYMLKRLPSWMMPDGFDFNKHDNYMRLENPETGSMIHGESNNDNFGTSGRVRACMLDEYSKWKHTDEAAWQSLSDVTACKLPVSSANGRTNHFYRLRAGEAGDIKKIRLHWDKHPLKDAAWYEAEKKRRSPADLAAEVDIDYSASVSNKAFPTFKHMLHCDKSVIINPDQYINLMCDFNITPMSWALSQDNQGVDYFFAEHTSHTRTTTAEHMEAFCVKYAGHPNKVLYVYGDAAGRHGSVQSLRSNYDIIKSIANRYGWQVILQITRSNPPVVDRLEVTNKRFYDWETGGNSWVKINPDTCPDLVNSLEQTRRKGDGVDKSENVEHISEAVGYYFSYKYQIAGKKVGSASRY